MVAPKIWSQKRTLIQLKILLHQQLQTYTWERSLQLPFPWCCHLKSVKSGHIWKTKINRFSCPKLHNKCDVKDCLGQGSFPSEVRFLWRFTRDTQPMTNTVFENPWKRKSRFNADTCFIYRLITAYLLSRVNLDKIMHARWDFDASSARTRRVSALDKHQNWSASALFCLNSPAQSKYAAVNLIHTRR